MFRSLPETKKSRRALQLVVAIIVILLLGAVYLGFLSSREMKDRIAEDFNAQQLALAHHAASIIGQHFQILKNELLTLSLSPSIQYVESVSWRNRMMISLSSVREFGVFRITLIEADTGKAYSVHYNQALFMETENLSETSYSSWSRDPANKNQIFVGKVREGVVKNSEPGRVMDMAVPVYQISPDEAHPLPTQSYTGVLLFSVDAGLLASKTAKPIRSGKTGYAWVIDGSGNFLYHLETDFIGQNAFEARQLQDPHISFTKINAIQKERMLEGEEGTSWYISGWHRGEIGKMRKLIAYSPVRIGAANADIIWSVAVVAPVSEVQVAVQKMYIRQAAIQVAFTVAVLIILFFLRSYEMLWVRTLEREIDFKTQNLERYAKRLRDSEERYRSLVESAEDLIYTLDENCRIVSMNSCWTRLTGQPVDSVTGRHVTDVIRFESPERVRKTVDRVISGSRSISREEPVHIGGRFCWMDMKFNKVSGIQWKEIPPSASVLVIARDLSEHKRMESQLFNVQKLASMGELSAGVAHEINNPLTIILGFSEMLLEKAPPGSREQEILKAITRQGENCKRIVDNLLAFARVPRQGSTDTDAGSALQKVIDIVGNTFLTEKIVMKSDIQENLPRVQGDARELEQVFLNIINNAVSAMPEGGNLRITARTESETVRIAFADDGHGIPPENQDKIFEPFFTTKEVGKGTGLGLSVSYGIVKKFGGDILVESPNRPAEDGRSGATFTVVLPIQMDTG